MSTPNNWWKQTIVAVVGIVTSILAGLLLFAGSSLFASKVHARDVRVALLVGNETGWKQDPRLQYVVKGDLDPLATVLRRVGFEVKVLKNPKATALRAALKAIQARVQRAPKVTTFLFYYTGHADRKFLHTGPKTKSPVSYKEFVQFLRSLPVQRRIALMDACYSGEVIRQFGSLARYKDLVRKGASGFQPIDISKTIPHQGEAQGLQVISSSVDYAWESKRYKASVFTHHLLRGLRGRADRDRDGKISVDELFNFVSDAMVKDIRQKPQMFGIIQRSRPYALAPAYHSQLNIGRNVLGTLHVKVANFVWKQRKDERQPVRLSVVHGWGTVDLKQGESCKRQKVYLPKGGKLSLSKEWRIVPCKRVAYTRKGSLVLPLQHAPESYSDWQLELSAGTWGSFAITRGAPLVGGDLGLRWKYVALVAEIFGGVVPFASGTQSLLYTGARIEGGYSGQWGRWGLFAGAYLGGGALIQNIDPSKAGLLFRYGLAVAPSFQLLPRWSLALSATAGFTLGQFGATLRNEFDGSLRLSLRYRI